ncbi:AMP-binding protein [Leeia oryzae]|uniref:AMP-binding protein n=1 Tax=Leeia oryzae TaxID=356662 RepID=UPI00035DB194|nr:AMP-binding protein [Leeia oryzae]
MTLIPLLPDTPPDQPFAYLRDSVVTRARFLAHVSEVADTLPDEGCLLNLCVDRYHFAVTLFAAIQRGLLTVLPNSLAPEHLAKVMQDHPGLQVVGDQADNPVPSLPWQAVRLQATASTPHLPMPMVDFHQTIACVYTSGSTGTPTAHYKQFGRVRLGILGGAEVLWSKTGGPCAVVGTVPIRHMYGLESSVLLPVLAGGMLMEDVPFFPADIADSLARLPAPRLLVITPFHLRKLIESGIPLPPVAAILSATAPLSAELAQAAEQAFGSRLVEIYGSTETGQIAMRETARETAWQRLSGVQLVQRGEETWAEGELFAQPQLLNDVVEISADGDFRLIDRKANMVNVAGKRSSMSFLNATLLQLPGVTDGVFFVPPRSQAQDVERLAAFVVAPGKTREEILAALRAHMDPVFLPRPLLLIDELPRDGNGKLLARSLTQLVNTHFDAKGETA